MSVPTTKADRRQRIEELGFDYARQGRRPVVACNLCGTDQFLALTHRDRYGFPVQAHGCRRCGLVFLNPVMTAEAYREFYSAVYRPLVSAYQGRLLDAKTIQAEQRVYAAELADFLEPFLSAGCFKTLLDIGGSTGVVAHVIGEHFGIKASVVDPAPLELDEARRLGLETMTGFIEDLDLGTRRFDLVLMCQTVDHLLDIQTSLRMVRRALSARGLFFVDIVDFRAAYLRNWSAEEAVKIDHPFYLTESTMSVFLERAGFEVVHVNYAADHLHVGYVCRPGPSNSDVIPAPRDVAALWHEIRLVQNADRQS